MGHTEGSGGWAAPDDQPQGPAWGEPPQPPSYAAPAVPQTPAHPAATPPLAPYPQSGPAVPAPPSPATARPIPGAPTGPGTPLTFRSWQPGIVALRPLPFGDFLVVPFKAMRFNRAAVVGGPMLMVLVTALLWAAALWLLFNDSQLDLLSPIPNMQGIEPTTVIVVIAAVVVSLAADMIASGMVVPAVARAAMGVKLSLGEAFRAVWSRLGALIVLYLMLVVALGVLGVFTIALTSGIGLMDATASILVTLLIVTPAWILLALFTSAYVAVARGAIIMERVGPFAALRRAFSLMPRRLWWSVLIILVTSVIVIVVGQALSIITQFGVTFATFLGPDQVWIAFTLLALSTIFQLAIQYVLQYSFLGSVSALIYLDLRFRKEGLAFELARAAEAQSSAGPRIG